MGLFEGRLSVRLAVFKNWRKLSPLPLGILLAALLAGGWRYSLALPSYTPADLASYNDQGEVKLTGLVVDMPNVTATGTALRVQVKDLAVAATAAAAPSQSLPVHGLLLVNLLPGGDWQYGDFDQPARQANHPLQRR